MPNTREEKIATLLMLTLLLLVVTMILFNKVYIIRDSNSVSDDSAIEWRLKDTARNSLTMSEQLEIEEPVAESIARHIQISRLPKTNIQWDANKLNLTDEEKLIFATIIRLECGGSTYECQMAAASVIINRMFAYNQTLREVIFAKKQFTPSPLIDKETGKSNYPPYETNWQVVQDICTYGPTIPSYILFFRSEYYHEWAEPYDKIGDLYFSYIA